MSQSALRLTSHSASLLSEIDFEGWRNAARHLLLEGIRPKDVEWIVDPGASSFPSEPTGKIKLPRAFFERAQTAILSSEPERFNLLYQIAWRHLATPSLMQIATDPDVARLFSLEKAVRRDIHKMRAFVRFKQVGSDFFAWFEPEHHIVERNAEFFRNRFTGMTWTIVTPIRSVSWNGSELLVGTGAARSTVPDSDSSTDLWKMYYRSIFNPARLKVKAMRSEMPKKYWKNLPESELIPGLIANAERSANEMIDRGSTDPSIYHDAIQAKHWSIAPAAPRNDVKTLEGIGQAVRGCRECPLWEHATQPVLGAGPKGASIVFVGEQPGDQEDITGQPFVGPAGRLFDDALMEAGIIRDAIFVTNAVKHFKFTPLGKRRIHSKPNAGEIDKCSRWVNLELSAISPRLVVALGATAAYSLTGQKLPMNSARGNLVERTDGLPVLVTFHPAFILRLPDQPAKHIAHSQFKADIVMAAQIARTRLTGTRLNSLGTDRG